MSAELKLAVVPVVDGVGEHHPAVEKAVEELLADLRDTPGAEVSIRQHAAEGSKGVLETLLITVLPVAIPAAVRIFRLWLERDKDRSVTVTIEEEGGTSTTIEASGKNASLDSLQRALTEATKLRREKD